MASLVKSVSLHQLVLGLVGGAVVVALGVFDYYEITPLMGVTIGSLSLIAAAYGLKPFGDTIGYQLLLSMMFAVFGFVWFVTEDQPILPIGFAIISVLGFVFYARQATKRGIWTPTN